MTAETFHATCQGKRLGRIDERHEQLSFDDPTALAEHFRTEHPRRGTA